MSIIKKVNGKPIIIANKHLIDHSQLANREAYGAHPISAIRKLPEKLHGLKVEDERLDTKINATKETLQNQIAETEQNINNSINTVEENARRIQLSDNYPNDRQLIFTDYDGNATTFFSGYEPDYDTITLDNDRLTLNRVNISLGLIGSGSIYDPLRLNPDYNSIIIDSGGVIQATGIVDIQSGIVRSGLQLTQDIDNIYQNINNEVNERVNQDQQLHSEIQNEISNRIIADNDIQAALNNEIEKLNNLENLVKGAGGYLDVNDFGTSTPSASDLTAYALQQIDRPSQSADNIPVGTKIINDFDNHTWVFNGADAVPQWSDLGYRDIVSVATDSTLGTVKGSNAQWEGAIDATGIISINGLRTYVQQNDTAINNIKDEYVLKTTTIAGKPLSSDITLEGLTITEGTNVLGIYNGSQTLSIHIPVALSELENDAEYINTAQLNAALATKQNALMTGPHIHIEDNLIWAEFDVASANWAGLMSAADKVKLDSIQRNAQVNVNADWAAIEGDAVILNKPTSLSHFTNDMSFITSAEADQAYVAQRTTTEGTYAYGMNATGDTLFVVDSEIISYGIAQRDENGYLFTLTPTLESHAANKAYVDSKVSNYTSGIGISITDSVISAVNGVYHGTIPAGAWVQENDKYTYTLQHATYALNDAFVTAATVETAEGYAKSDYSYIILPNNDIKFISETASSMKYRVEGTINEGQLSDISTLLDTINGEVI